MHTVITANFKMQEARPLKLKEKFAAWRMASSIHPVASNLFYALLWPKKAITGHEGRFRLPSHQPRKRFREGNSR